MNNKGFAISSILYLIIIIAGILLLSILGAITFRKDILSSKLNAINRELDENFVSQYRYITESGEWSSWIDYYDKSEINHTVNIKRVPNLGTRGSQYDLNNTTNVVLEIVNGVAYLKFNGTDSKAVSDVGEETVINTAILEVKKESVGGIVGFSTSVDGFYYTNAPGYHAFRIGKEPDYLTSNVSYNNNKTYRYVISLDKESGSYFVYQDGSLVEMNNYTDIKRITEVKLGYLGYTSNPLYLKGNIYNVTLATGIISKEDAKEISKFDGDHNLEFYGIRPEIEYKFIEYRMVEINEKDSSYDVFKTRYVKDFTNGSSVEYNSYIEMEAYARFEKYDDFKGVVIGGSYSGTYEIGTSGKVTITSGNFTHLNSNVYNVDDTEIITPYSLSTSYGSGLIVFVGSDLTRFSDFNKPFIYAEFSDRSVPGYNEWHYYNGSSWVTFVPQDDDAIVGYVLKRRGSNTLDIAELFNQSFTFNVAIGKNVIGSSGTSNISRVVDGEIEEGEYYTNGLENQNIEIDLGEEYNIIEIRVFRGKSEDSIVVYDAKTVLYNTDKTDSLILWDSGDKGLYVENPYGLGVSLYVDQSKMSKTTKTRYVEDCSNGRYLVSNNSFEPTNEWHEISVFDIGGSNVAEHSNSIVSRGTDEDISYVNDGNNETIFIGGTGEVCITIDLGREYAIKEVNSYRNTTSYINAFVKISLKEELFDTSYYTFYDSSINGIYREVNGGLRAVYQDNITYEDVGVIEGLIGWYKLAGNAQDSSGRMNHGVIYGSPPIANCNFGPCLNFSTTSHYIEIPHDDYVADVAFGANNNFSISVWAYPREWPGASSYGALVNKATGGSWSNATSGIWASTTVGFRVALGSNRPNNPSGSYNVITYKPPLNNWHHLVMVADGTNIIFYCDGEQVGSFAISSVTYERSTNDAPITIGRRIITATNDKFNGMIEDLRIYNRTLSEDEIMQLYYYNR